MGLGTYGDRTGANGVGVINGRGDIRRTMEKRDFPVFWPASEQAAANP